MAKVLLRYPSLNEIRIKKKWNSSPPPNYSSLELGFFAWHPPNMERYLFIFMIIKSEEMYLVIFWAPPFKRWPPQFSIFPESSTIHPWGERSVPIIVANGRTESVSCSTPREIVLFLFVFPRSCLSVARVRRGGGGGGGGVVSSLSQCGFGLKKEFCDKFCSFGIVVAAAVERDFFFFSFPPFFV